MQLKFNKTQSGVNYLYYKDQRSRSQDYKELPHMSDQTPLQWKKKTFTKEELNMAQRYAVKYQLDIIIK